MTPPRLATMGMFIIDEFQFLDPTTNQDLGNRGLQDQIGGGGCYFAIGARVFLPPSHLQMVIDRGSDWRDQDQAVLDRFDRSTAEAGPSSMWHYRSRPDGTTRAVNIYKGEQRGFKYLSPKIRLEPKDLLECSPADPARLPEWIHLICSPERALETISQIDHILAKSENGKAKAFPKLIYEPIPDSCLFENLQDCLKVLPRLAVFSPNHEEAAQLLGLGEQWEKALQQALVDTDCTTDLIVRFITNKLASGFTKHLERPDEGERKESGPFGPVICIRSGAWGSVVGQAGLGFRHVPAWHTSASEQEGDAEGGIALDTNPSRIKDVTGAGNSFLGGFSAHLVQAQEGDGADPMRKLVEAAMHGAVSASLVIEQLGLPSFEVKGGQELWNGHTAADRLELLRAQLS